MSPQRYFFDSVQGQPWRAQGLEFLSLAASRGYASPAGFHHEAAEARLLGETALASIKNSLRLLDHTLIPVHTMQSAFRMALAAIPTEAKIWVNPTIRRGLRDLVCNERPAAVLGRVDSSGGVDVSSIPAGTEWIVTSATNIETGVIDDWTLIRGTRPDLRETQVWLEATEWFGRAEPAIPYDIAVACSNSWAGPMSCAWILDASNCLPPLTVRELQRMTPDLAILTASAGALEQTTAELSHHLAQARTGKKLLIEQLSVLPGITFMGNCETSAPHLLSFTVHHVDSEAVTTAMNAAGFAIGTDSACVTGAGERSHVLEAMGIAERAGHVRISSAIENTVVEWQELATTLVRVIQNLQEITAR